MLIPLYFAYSALIDPSRLEEIAPDASFKCIAHLPETKLVFPYDGDDWEGGLPSVKAEPGNTVWGAIFDVPAKMLKAIDAAEQNEGRSRTTDFSAVDREGHRHKVVTHVHNGKANGEHTPSRTYMERVVAGGRHWGLPTGWVAGLQEYVEDSLF